MLHRTASFAMGTRFELLLAGRDRAHARAAAEGALAIIEECDARYSRFRSDSLLSRINREAGRAWVRVDPQTFELLAACAAFQRITDGAFDICVGRPMDLLRESAQDRGGERLLEAGAFELEERTSCVRFTRPGTLLDLGGIAKGHALDLAVDCLSQSGIECAFLHGGTSSVIALGAPDELPRGWKVDLGAEFHGATADLKQRSLSLSAARRRPNAQDSSQGAAHVLDPRSGIALCGAARAAVSMHSAREAEVWSTALLVLAARETGLEHELSKLDPPRDFECLVADPEGEMFAHAAHSFEALSGLPSLTSSTAR